MAVDHKVSGKLGVGVSPARQLHVASGATQTVAVLESTGATAKLAFVDTATTDDTTVTVESNGDDLALRAGGTVAVRVLANGDVGFGASPSHPLHISNAALATLIAMLESTNGTTQSVQFRLKSAGASSAEWALINSGNRWQINEIANAAATPAGEIVSVRGTTGRVGIGNNAPGERFAVKDDDADTVPIASVEQTGTNGSKVRIFVGTQDPSGTISANPGDLYLRDNGTSSSTYVNNGSGDANTTWKDLGAAGVGATEQKDVFPLLVHPTGTGTQALFNNANMFGCLCYIANDTEFDRVNLHTGVSWSGTFTARVAIYQSDDGTIKTTMTKLFDETFTNAAAGTNTTFGIASTSGNLVLKRGWYWLAIGRSSGSGSPFIECMIHSSIPMHDEKLAGGPSTSQNLGLSSAVPATINPTTLPAPTAGEDLGIIHKLRLIT
jgi:hypothetical protein